MNSVGDLVVSCVDVRYSPFRVSGSLEQVVQCCGIIGNSIANGTIGSSGEEGIGRVGFVLGLGPLVEFAVLLESGRLREVDLIAVLVLAWAIRGVCVTLNLLAFLA